MERLYKIIAWIVSRKFIADRLIAYADAHPYTDIYNDGVLYMRRGWVFNPYQLGEKKGWWNHFMAAMPSVRVHHIVKPDTARHHHDHPWDARTMILRGQYHELRLENGFDEWYIRQRGDTAAVRFGEYHTIISVPEAGAYTLFITWKYQGTWGFLVDGKKVPHRDYNQTKEV
jgi:hypothetical protein